MTRLRFLLPFATACGPPREPGPLVDHGSWALRTDADLFPAHFTEPSDCGIDELGAFYLEGAALEFATARCAYFSLEQPSLVELRQGDELAFTWYHSLLTAEAPGEGHVALGLADDIVWEASVTIPADAAVFDVVVPVTISAPAGTPVRLHLHNHGSNTWLFLDFDALPR
jgi:hypothetical protein